MLLGLFTGVLAFGISNLEEVLVKYSWWPAQHLLDHDLDNGRKVTTGTWIAAYSIFCLYAIVLVGLAALMTLFWAPGAAGSGVAESMSYMNGICYPGLIGISTIIVKSLGVVFAVAGGIKIGKEGPLAHIGSIMGVIILYIPWPFNKKFRNDKDK